MNVSELLLLQAALILGALLFHLVTARRMARTRGELEVTLEEQAAEREKLQQWIERIYKNRTLK